MILYDTNPSRLRIMVFRYYTMINRIVNRKLTVSLFRQSIPLTSNPGPIETLIATKLTSEFDPRKVSIYRISYTYINKFISKPYLAFWLLKMKVPSMDLGCGSLYKYISFTVQLIK